MSFQKGKDNINWCGGVTQNLICQQCKGIFNSDKAKRKFCSRKCKGEFSRGKPAWNKGKKLHYQVWNKGLTKETDERVKINSQGIAKHIKEHPLRYWLGKKRLDISGKNCHTWKGGITPLEKLIRESLEYKTWRINVYKRDYYTCRECFRKDGNIIAHHIKSFTNIFQEFLQQYSQFSPIDDKETLVRLSFTYQPFWNVNNGKTLCEKCHKSLKRLSKFLGGLRWLTGRE